MAAIADAELGAIAPKPDAVPNRQRRSFPVWRWVILLLAGRVLPHPALGGAAASPALKAFPDVVKQSGFAAAFGLSVRLAVITTVLTLVLMVPTTVYVHLRLPRLRRVLEVDHHLADRHPARCAHHRRAADRPGEPEGHAVPARAGVRRPRHAVRLPLDRRRTAVARPEDALRGVKFARRQLADDAAGGWCCRTCAPRCSPPWYSRSRWCLGEYTMASLDLLPDVPGVDRAVRPRQRPGVGGGFAAGAVRDLAVPDGHRHGRPQRRPAARRSRSHPVYASGQQGTGEAR